MKRTIRRFLTGVSVAFVVAVVLMWHFAREIRLTLDRPIPLSEAVLFEIKSGQSITKIAREFASRRWLSHAIYLRIEATRLGLATRIQAGTYEVLPNSTVRELLRKFVAGEVKHYSVTLVEGIQFRTLRSQLAKLPGIVTTIGGLTDDEIMLKLSAPGESPEGRFFPSTYFYIHRSLDTDLLTRAYSKLQTVLNDQWTTRADDLPYSTPYEALIMASIIEKETGLAAERSQIAGVFIRRLQQNMLLQTDPTVIYGLGERFEGNVRRVDLATDTPYNSYIRPGLPPTPIAMPGEAAIRAALHPAPGSDLYFVARGDGSHEFSATLTAHNAAVRRFQLEQRKHEAR